MKKLVFTALSLILPLCAMSEDRFPFFIWNMGFMNYADVAPTLIPFHKKMRYFEQRLPFDKDHYITNIQEGDIVWVEANKLLKFTREVLPEVSARFFLVVTGSDATFPKDYDSPQEVADLVNAHQILHLYVQNCDFKHRRVSQIPIGIDLHTVIHWPKRFGEKNSKDLIEQLDEIKTLITKLKPTKDRKCSAIMDFAFNDSMRNSYHRYKEFGEDRKTICARLEKQGVAKHITQSVPRQVLWKMKGEYAFDISPPGNGVDCHRTWESLLLGCIVIVKDSYLNPLFEGLPVVIVKSWDEVTKENMKKWQKQYGDALTNPEYRKKLYLKYWLEPIRKRQKNYLRAMALHQGNWALGKTSKVFLRGTKTS